MLIIKSRERENKMNVRVIKDADGVAQSKVASVFLQMMRKFFIILIIIEKNY